MDSTQFTELLRQADEGNADAANRLFQLVQEQLKQIVAHRKRQIAGAADISTTGLVDEAFCQLVGQQNTIWENDARRKFFAYLANKIHGLLIDAARARATQKRGGGYRRADKDVDELAVPGVASRDDADLLIDLQNALHRFAEFAAEDALIFRLRYFIGCTFAEAGEIVGRSEAAAKRSFQRSRAWLKRELRDYDHES